MSASPDVLSEGREREHAVTAALTGNQYMIRRKILTLAGAKFHVYDPQERVCAFVQQAAFKLKEDIRVYADESKSREIMTIQARQIIDFSAAYDVVDTAERTKVGALRRKGLSSIVRDSWEFLDANDQPIATLQEDSMAMALLRRFLSNLIPQSFNVAANGRPLAAYNQRFNPFVHKLDVTVHPGGGLDPRLALAGGILLSAIEGRQQ